MFDRSNLRQLVRAKTRRLFSLTIISIIVLSSYVLGTILGVSDRFLTPSVLILSLLLFVITIFFENYFYSRVSSIIRLSPGKYNQKNLISKIDPQLEESLRQAYPLLTEAQLMDWFYILQLEIARHISAGETLAFFRDSSDGYVDLQPYEFIISSHEQRPAD
jgi:hypothetical protein